MTQINLNDDQTRLLDGASFPILIVDSHGRTVAKVSPQLQPSSRRPVTEDEWVAEAKRRIAEDDGTRYTHAELMAHLRELAPE